jgi:hypothetical protein
MAPIEFIFRGQQNEPIPATIRPLNLIPDTLSWLTSWFPGMLDLAGNRLYEDSHWDVPSIWEEALSNDFYRVIVIEAENMIQGYTVVWVKNYLGIDGKPCAHVAFVAVAPWNRAAIGNRRKIKGVGKTLLAMSSLISLKHTGSLVFELHSLPGAEGFYQRVGMRETGRYSAQGLKEFRMENPKALALVRPLLPSINKKEK